MDNSNPAEGGVRGSPDMKAAGRLTRLQSRLRIRSSRGNAEACQMETGATAIPRSLESRPRVPRMIAFTNEGLDERSGAITGPNMLDMAAR
jgi:hypothetical protein